MHVLIAISGLTFGMLLHILNDGDSSINEVQAWNASSSVITIDLVTSASYQQF